MTKDKEMRWLIIVAFLSVWVLPLVGASYEWRYGQYYDYGWWVGPAAVGLLVRRWGEVRGELRWPGRWWVAGWLLWLVPWLLLARVLGYADPLWRLPMWAGGAAAIVTGHVLVGYCAGWRESLKLGWITCLLASALPWPTVVETRLVHGLTATVVASVAELFQLLGKPVLVVGERLSLHELTVEVTDGCSGMRSLQSFLMATWFFAELQRLRAGQVLVLLVAACGAALVVNIARAFVLAQICFSHGAEASANVHDALGVAAFLLSAGVFYFISGRLADWGPRKRVRKMGDRR